MGVCASSAIEFMPPIQKVLTVVRHEPRNDIELGSGEPTASLQPNRIEPKLRLAVVSFDMHVRRLVPVGGVKENPIWAISQNRGHRLMLGSSRSLGKRETKAGWWIGEISTLRIVWYFRRLPFPIRVFLAYDSF